jgi:2-oxoglutarate ferredoxin oxidoreductase subunit alpha
LVGVDSDEHDEAGHITESATMRLAMHEKRLSKMKGIREEALMPTTIGDVANADTIIVTWGSNRAIIAEALELSSRDAVAGLHFHQVYPLPAKAKKLLAKKKIVVLENNATGQFANLLKLEYGVEISENILKYNGDPFSVEEVVKKVNAIR